MTGVLREAGAVVAVFLIVYNLSFQAAPSVTSGRVVLLLLLLGGGQVLWEKLAALARAYGVWLAWIGGLIAYSLLVWRVSGCADFTQTSRLINFTVWCLLTPAVLVATCTPSLDRFLRTFTLATLLQAGCVLVAYLSPAFREWTAGLLVQGGNIPLTTGSQVAGFSNSAGAATSVTLSLGVFCALLAMTRSQGSLRPGLYLLAALASGGATVAVGRTGLMLSALFLGLVLLQRLTLRQAISGAGILVVLVVATLPALDWVRTRVAELNPAVSATLEWSLGAFGRMAADASLVELAQSPIPELSLSTLLGTGLVSLPNGSNAAGHDAGYVQTYFALGLVASVVFYGGLALFLLSCWCRRPWPMLLVLIAATFAIEVKEPFIFKYVVVQFTLTLLAAPASSRAGDGRPSQGRQAGRFLT